jgi:uncharacterized protein (TIGR03083 family)
MESSRLLTLLAADFDRLRAVAARDLTAPVPSCPGWTVTDLVRHVAEVYAHKVECMRQGRSPADWPPDLTGEEPIVLLDRTYADLRAEFAQRGPLDPSYTWYEPDQSVGFWIRRMAQETVIHRIDAELALGEPVTPVPDDLAVDGVDEVLVVFLSYMSHRWPEELGPALKEASGETVRVGTGTRSWSVTAAPQGVEVGTGDPGTVAAVITGPPDPLLRWLWGRGGDDEILFDGDPDAVAQLRRLLVAATQ